VQFEFALQALRTFVKREGHADVKNLHTENGYPLGRWIGKRRLKKDKLSNKQIAELDALGMIWSAKHLRGRR
jgi:hypothetical protein